MLLAERVGFEPTYRISAITRFRVERVTAGLRYLSALRAFWQVPNAEGQIRQFYGPWQVCIGRAAILIMGLFAGVLLCRARLLDAIQGLTPALSKIKRVVTGMNIHLCCRRPQQALWQFMALLLLPCKRYGNSWRCCTCPARGGQVPLFFPVTAPDNSCPAARRFCFLLSRHRTIPARQPGKFAGVALLKSCSAPQQNLHRHAWPGKRRALSLCGGLW